MTKIGKDAIVFDGEESAYHEKILELTTWLSGNTELYIITQCFSDEQEQVIYNYFINILSQYGLNHHKLLFCSTPIGRGHIARHLESTLHIDGFPHYFYFII